VTRVGRTTDLNKLDDDGKITAPREGGGMFSETSPRLIQKGLPRKLLSSFKNFLRGHRRKAQR